MPPFRLWKQIIASCVKGTTLDSSRWKLVKRAFAALSHDIPDFWPDEMVLRNGIAASEATMDSQLAADLLARLAIHSKKTENASALDSSMVERSLLLCLRCGDLKSFRSVLESVDALSSLIPEATMRHLLELGVKGYTSSDNPELAEALVLAMKNRGIRPR